VSLQNLLYLLSSQFLSRPQNYISQPIWGGDP